MQIKDSCRASADTHIYVLFVTQSNNGLCSWVLEKSKDSECGIGYSYKLEEIQMEDDETTCVIKTIGSHEACEKKVSLGSNQERIFVLLKNEILSKFSQDGDMETTIKNIATQWTEQPTDKRTFLIRGISSFILEYCVVKPPIPIKSHCANSNCFFTNSNGIQSPP